MSKNWNGQRTTLGNMPFCHATGHTSPAEALTAFGYVTMEFYGRRLPTLIYIYGPFLKLLTLTCHSLPPWLSRPQNCPFSWTAHPFNPLLSTKPPLFVDGMPFQPSPVHKTGPICGRIIGGGKRGLCLIKRTSIFVRKQD